MTPDPPYDCGNCRYSEPAMAGDDPVLECRRYPPQIFPVDDDVRWSWPHMASTDWCGEHRLDPTDPLSLHPDDRPPQETPP